MRNNILLFVCAYTLVCVASAALVPPINKCKAEDSKCIRKSAQDVLVAFAQGLPDLGVEKVEPMYFKTLDASSPNLKLLTSSLNVHGLQNCIVKKIQRDVANSKIHLKFLCPTILDGDYEMKGQILFIPIEGKGKMRGNIPKMLVSIDADLGESVKKGVKHYTIKSWKSTYELKERATLEFENLFNGNELLSRASKEIIRSSANEIIAEVGSPLVNAIIGRVVDNMRRFFGNVPMSELTLDV